MKSRLDMLWEEFQLPIWVTEFTWNSEQSVDFGDHSRHADILDSFYRLAFSHQVMASSLSVRVTSDLCRQSGASSAGRPTL